MKVDFNYPGLCKEKTAAGNVRWRVRVEGEKRRKITIPVGPAHPEFQVFYNAGRFGERLKRQKTAKPIKGTLDELCLNYFAWMETQVSAGNLSPATVSSRKRGLNQARSCITPNGIARMGAVTAAMPLKAFAHIRDSFGTRTGAGATCIKALRAAYTWGAERGYPEDSPVFKLGNVHVSGDGAEPWREDDKKKFLACHGPGTMARRWFLLADNTAGRIGDSHRLGPRHEVIRDDQQFISWQPRKRGSQPVEVPLSAELMHEIAGLPQDAGAYLLSENGAPFASSGSLDNRVRKWIIEAGLFEIVKNQKGENEKRATRSQHGIRKRRAEMIAEAGGSVYEVMAYLSHSDPKTAAIYTKKVERLGLAKRAAERAKAKY